jgi:hydroxyethylthiazole kinase-like uncharacterized protein yjeF
MSEPPWLDADLLRDFPLPALSSDGDKEDRGRALVIGGSPEVPGAVVLAGNAALRAGAGKLQIVTDRQVALAIGVAVVEARVVAGFGGCAEHAADAAAVVLGPGMDRAPCRDTLGALLDCPVGVRLILDAAALGCLAGFDTRVRQWPGGVALLPHSREMSLLLECEPEEVEIDPLNAARRAAERYAAVALVKGGISVIAAPDGRTFRFRGGGVGLATSGSGDVLAGLVGGIAARGADPLTATLWGVYLHGEAGRALSARMGRVGFLAREIADEVPALLGR